MSDTYMVIVLVPMQAPFIAYQRIQYPHRADFPKDNHTDQPFATTGRQIFAQTTMIMVGRSVSGPESGSACRSGGNGHQAGDRVARLYGRELLATRPSRVTSSTRARAVRSSSGSPSTTSRSA